MSTQQLFAALRHQAATSARLGLVALAVIILAGGAMAYTALPLVKAWFVKADAAIEPTSDAVLKARKSKFDSTLAAASDAIDKRWPFAAERKIVQAPPRTPTPTVYRGPALVGMVGDSALFYDGKMRKVGGESIDGVSVLSVDPPWTARVHWMGSDFTVELFQRNPASLVAGPDIFRPGPVGNYVAPAAPAGGEVAGRAIGPGGPGTPGGPGGPAGPNGGPTAVLGGRPANGGPPGSGPGQVILNLPSGAVPIQFDGSQTQTFTTPDGTVIRTVTSVPIPANGQPVEVPPPPPPPDAPKK